MASSKQTRPSPPLLDTRLALRPKEAADTLGISERTLRSLLWLKGIKEAKPAVEVLSEVEKIADRKLSGVRNALEASAHHGWDEFDRLYQDVEALGEIADGW